MFFPRAFSSLSLSLSLSLCCVCLCGGFWFVIWGPSFLPTVQTCSSSCLPTQTLIQSPAFYVVCSACISGILTFWCVCVCVCVPCVYTRILCVCVCVCVCMLQECVCAADYIPCTLEHLFQRRIVLFFGRSILVVTKYVCVHPKRYRPPPPLLMQ